jgi:hypothetical protein
MIPDIVTALTGAVLIYGAVSSGTVAAGEVPGQGNTDYFRIEVIDKDTGRGVPLVELRTTNNIRCFTDSNGLVAFHEPGLMNQRVFFHVSSHGYRFPKDGFGFSGARLDVTPGGRATLKLKRINIAERLYRMTGGGIYRDSYLLGAPAPIKQPLLNGRVFGCDSVQVALYRDKIYWFWGDTSRPAYPLGNFFMTGATSLLPARGGLDPSTGVDLDIFVNHEGFARKMAPMPDPKPCWCDAFVTLKDDSGRERLFAAYARVRADMSAYERGLVEFDDDSQQFVKILEFDPDAPVIPGGHPFRHTVNGVEYLYFDIALPLVRVRADIDSLRDLSSYEAFTPLAEGSRQGDLELDRDAEGRVRFGWKRRVAAVRPKDREILLKSGALEPDEALIHLRDVDTGDPVIPHNGSVYWNDYRRRWVMIRCQSWGTSMLGETWYAEADTPLGPWVYARKIITHDRYSFYNPKHHPMFDQQGGRIIYFEGTYANTFSGNPDQTPRYDYNQIMYRLDLSDERLVLPVPVYEISDGTSTDRTLATRHRLPPDGKPRPIAFFALDRPRKGCIPVFAADSEEGIHRLRVDGPGPSVEPLFFALPKDAKERHDTTVPLYEFTLRNGSSHEGKNPVLYAAGEEVTIECYLRAEKPLCFVWQNPMRWSFPIDG